MNLSQEDVRRAATETGLTAEQADALWARLESGKPLEARATLAHVAYYLGALLVVIAMGWFMAEAMGQYPGFAIAALGGCYAVLLIIVGFFFWEKKDLKIPGGLLYTVAVCMTPIIVYGLEKAAGQAPGSYRHWLWQYNADENAMIMEFSTVLAGLLMLYYVRFPFLVTPVLLAGWFLVLSAMPAVLGPTASSQRGQWATVMYGVVVLAISFLIDRRTKEDFAFWGYLAGALGVWGGLTAMGPGSELSKFIYLLISLGFIGASVLLRRGVFIAVGSLGVVIYLVDLCHRLFRGSLLFPLTLSALGLGVLFLGVLFARKGAAWQAAALAALPEGVRKTLPSERAPPA